VLVTSLSRHTELARNNLWVDTHGVEADLAADEVVRAVTAGVAVGRNVSLTPKTGGLASLVVDGNVGIAGRVGRLGEDEAVAAVRLSASDGLAGESGGADCAGDILDAVAGQLEVDGCDGGPVPAEGIIADVDVLVVCSVWGAAVRWVRAIRSLRYRSCESSSEERGGNEELHVDGLVWWW
jgi:hypothetical protein